MKIFRILSFKPRTVSFAAWVWPPIKSSFTSGLHWGW